MTAPTTSQVNKAGRTLRRYERGVGDPSGEQIMAALDIVYAFRAAHQRPLVTANNGLRSMVRTAGCKIVVSQRLKRFTTILNKLSREPTLALSNMQDIGGCRAILDSMEEIRRVEARLKRNRPVTGYSDYVTTPRSSGYRAVHVVVLYDNRQIEVQLRTHAMHAWAIAVEELSSRVGQNLKADGQHAVQQLMAAISEAVALEERGQIVDSALLSEIARLRGNAAPYLRVETVR